MQISLFSQSLFALGLDDAIEATAQAGYEAIELACCRPHLDLQTARRNPEKVAHKIARAGLGLSALSCFNTLTDPSVLDDELAAAETFIRLAPLFGTSTVKMTPGPPAAQAAAPAHWHCLERAIEALVPLAREVGVRLAFETHMRQLTDTQSSAQKLLALTPADVVGLTVDYSNLTFAGADAAQAAVQLAPRTYNVHLKNGVIDSDGGWRFGALDEGWTDIASVLRELCAAGYDVPLAVECLGPQARAEPLRTAQQDLRILQRYLDQVAWPVAGHRAPLDRTVPWCQG